MLHHLAWPLATSVAVLGLFGCRDKVVMKPGTGALRIRTWGLKGAAARVHAHQKDTFRTADMVDGDATLTDLDPGYWGITVVTGDGRGGHFNTMGGHDAKVEAGEVNDVTVSVDPGLTVSGGVFDSATKAPLGGVEVRPKLNVGSDAWPVELPTLRVGSQADGAFALAGIQGTPPVQLWFLAKDYVPRTLTADGAKTGWKVALAKKASATLALDESLTVQRVDPAGPAAEVGLEVGDKITSFLSQPDQPMVEVKGFTLPTTLFDLLDKRGHIVLVVLRGGATKRLEVNLPELPRP